MNSYANAISFNIIALGYAQPELDQILVLCNRYFVIIFFGFHDVLTSPYLGRNSRNFFKSMKLIILLSFSSKIEMHSSCNFCSWCNDQQQSVSVYIFSKFVLFWSLLTQCGRGVMISKKIFRNSLKMPTWKNRSSLVKFNGRKVWKFCLCKSIGNCLGKCHISNMPLFRNSLQ